MSRSDEKPRLSEVVGVFRQRMPAAVLASHVDRVWINELHGPTSIDVVPDADPIVEATVAAMNAAGRTAKGVVSDLIAEFA